MFFAGCAMNLVIVLELLNFMELPKAVLKVNAVFILHQVSLDGGV